VTSYSWEKKKPKGKKKMNRVIVKLTLATLSVSASAFASANIVNGDFATGDLTGWSSVGNVGVSSNVAGLITNYASADDVAALLGTTHDALNNVGGVTATIGSAIAQTFTMDKDGSVSFTWAHNSGDYMPFNDFSVVSIDGNLTLLSNVASTGNFGSTGWKTSTFSLSAGTHTIGFGIVNALDGSVDSNLQIAGVQAVPEPMSMVALATGAAALLRRRRN
jgi:hypothetical protein